jgi:hypothetical protein
MLSIVKTALTRTVLFYQGQPAPGKNGVAVDDAVTKAL